MTDYKRLTERDEFGNADIIGIDSLLLYGNLTGEEDNKLTNALNRFAELEDMIEQGMLVQLDENLMGAEVIGIHKCTDGTYYPDLFDENIVIGFTSDGVVTWNNTHCFNDWFKNGYYFPNTGKGRAEAEARLEELIGGGK